jgi:hypothetical protein
MAGRQPALAALPSASPRSLLFLHAISQALAIKICPRHLLLSALLGFAVVALPAGAAESKPAAPSAAQAAASAP